MKGIAFLLVILLLFGVFALLVVTNPGLAEFNAWYNYSIKNQQKQEINTQIANNLRTGFPALDEALSVGYDALAADVVNAKVDNYLDELQAKTRIQSHIIYTDYYIITPANFEIHVQGFLNGFMKVN